MADPFEVSIPAEDEASYYERAQRSIVRIEQQPAYLDDPWPEYQLRWSQGEDLDRWAAETMADWLTFIDTIVARGVIIERVRITSNPPTLNQRFCHWLGQLNDRRGERMLYLTGDAVTTLGLRADLGTTDWWLFDRSHLMTFDFDDRGRWLGTRVTTNPERIAAAHGAWQAVRPHATASPPWMTAEFPVTDAR